MTTIPSVPGGEAGLRISDEDLEDDFKPLTAQEAQQWRANHPAVSVWRVVRVQAVAAVLVTLLTWLVTGQVGQAMSAAYGAASVLLPAVVFARGMRKQQGVKSAGAALTGLMVWEMAKLGLTLAMLLLAPRLVGQLSWLALLAGFVVTMKMYWLALWRFGRSASVKIN